MTLEGYSEKSRQTAAHVSIDGVRYSLVQTQRGAESAVYKSSDTFLRIGNPIKIKRDLKRHREMLSHNFPVSEILSEGELLGQKFYTESSLGSESISNIFACDVAAEGTISDESFNMFSAISEKFALAQLGSAGPNASELAEGVHIDLLCDELPEHREAVRSRFATIIEHTASLPIVLTHGDFNPMNLYPAGAIDFEDAFYAPLGYDLVSAITHVDYFPDGDEYEFRARYRFTESQRYKYFERMDDLFSHAGIEPLSSFKHDFSFCRGVWSLVSMHDYPKIQKFRYDKFIQEYLS